MAKAAKTTRAKKPARKTTPRRSPSRKRQARASQPPPEATEAETELVEEEAAPESLVPSDVELPVSVPEAGFSARVAPPPPERPKPTARRAIFFDVENTSRPRDVERMLAHLAIDRSAANTDFVASGNWRVIGNETGRILAARGASLVHSAPATGVRDWSDLRIAVAAGVWLASARPGDQVEIVSDDKAFDVVGDVAATLGVHFRRLSFRKLAGGPARGAEPAAEAAAPAAKRGGRGRRRPERKPRGARVSEESAPAPAEPQEAEETQAQPAAVADGAAPHDDVLNVVKELLGRSPGGVSLDTVANRLKALGFQRPPGSPRLVTRLRSFKELDVSPRGQIRLRGGAAAAQRAEDAEAGEAAAESAESAGGEAAASNGAAPAKRRRRRGGRGRGRGGAGSSAGGAAPASGQ